MNTKRRIDAWEGQGLVEYGLVIIMVSIGAMAMLVVLGTTLRDFWFDAAVQLFP